MIRYLKTYFDPKRGSDERDTLEVRYGQKGGIAKVCTCCS